MDLFMLGMMSGIALSITSGILLGCIVSVILKLRYKQIEDDQKGGL